MRVWAMAQNVFVLLDDATKLALSTIAGDRSRPLKQILRASIVLRPPSKPLDGGAWG